MLQLLFTLCILPIVMTSSHLLVSSICSILYFYITLDASYYFFTHPDKIDGFIFFLVHVTLFMVSVLKCVVSYLSNSTDDSNLVAIHVD